MLESGMVAGAGFLFGSSLVLLFALVRWPRTTEPVRAGGKGAPATQASAPEGEGEETPWLWQEAQRLNRLKK